MKTCLTTVCIVALLFLTGCFDSEETLVINSDLSGTAHLRFEVQNTYLDQTRMMYEELAKMMPDADLPTDPKDMMFNKADLEEALAGDESGVVLISYAITESDDSHIWDMKFTFEDINRIDALYNALSPDEDGEEASVQGEPEQPLMAKQADGTWLFYRSFEDATGDDEYSGGEEEYFIEDYAEEDEEYRDEYSGEGDESEHPIAVELKEGMGEFGSSLEQMAKEFGQHKMRFVVTFPGDIIESNATVVDGRTATWEYTMEQLDKNPPEQRAVIK